MCHLWAGETFGQSFLRWILMNQNTVIWLCLSNFISRWHGPRSFSFSSWTLSYRTLWQRLSMFFMLLLSFKAWHANSCDTTYQEPDYFWQDRRNWKLKLFFFSVKLQQDKPLTPPTPCCESSQIRTCSEAHTELGGMAEDSQGWKWS